MNDIIFSNGRTLGSMLASIPPVNIEARARQDQANEDAFKAGQAARSAGLPCEAPAHLNDRAAYHWRNGYQFGHDDIPV